MQKIFSKITIVSAVLFSLTSAAQELKMDSLAKEFMAQNHVPGMSIAVIDQGETHLYNYGYASEVKKLKTSSNTIYRINSLTKAVTTTLAGIAQAEGKLKLDDPFVRYFPQAHQNKELSHITIAELLAHIAAMPHAFDPSPKQFGGLVDFLQKFKPAYPIGTRYSYSNYSIGIVGYVLENAYNDSYENILNKKIVSPLKLKSTYLNIPKNKENEEAMGHDAHNNLVPIKKEISVLFAAGDIKSTIDDMSKYLKAQMDNKGISDKNFINGTKISHDINFCFENASICQQLAWQEHDLRDLGKSTSDTLGNYFVSQKAEDKLSNKITFVDKTGGGAGMSSYMAYIPSQQKGVVILLNKDLGDARISLGRRILKNL